MRAALFEGAGADANRRQLQRVYVERMEALLTPPSAPAAAPGGFGGGGGGFQVPPLLQAPNARRGDLAAIARAELRAVREASRAKAAGATGVVRAHWQDLADRADEALDRQRGR